MLTRYRRIREFKSLLLDASDENLVAALFTKLPEQNIFTSDLQSNSCAMAKVSSMVAIS